MPRDPTEGDPTQYFDASNGHRIVAHLRDGRVIALGRYSQVVAPGNVNVIVRIPDLKYVETAIQVEFYSNPDTYLESGWMDKKITGNLVGLTVYGVAAGTTLTTEIVAIGPP